MSTRYGQADWQGPHDASGPQDQVPPPPPAGASSSASAPSYDYAQGNVPPPVADMSTLRAATMPTAPAQGLWYAVVMQGQSAGPFPLSHVQTMIRKNQVHLSTLVSVNGQNWQSAESVPGLYSERSWLVAIILSAFLGTLGVDRFYLGHIGLGIAKLLLSWLTFGLWQLIDLILIALRRVDDTDGRPLR